MAKNDNYYLVTTKTSVPAPANGTGTIGTQGIGIVGTGTKFITNSELQKGSWIVDTAQDEVRIVDRVDSDTVAYLREAFSSDITPGATPSIIHNTSLNVKEISVGIASGGVDGEIDGVVLVAGTSVVFSKSSDSKDGFKSFVDPIIVDGTGTSILVSIIR